AAEAFDEEVVVRVALVQDLDRNASTEVLVLGEVDVCHPARAELADDAVAAVEKGVDERVGARHLLTYPRYFSAGALRLSPWRWERRSLRRDRSGLRAGATQRPVRST